MIFYLFMGSEEFPFSLFPCECLWCFWLEGKKLRSKENKIMYFLLFSQRKKKKLIFFLFHIFFNLYFKIFSPFLFSFYHTKQTLLKMWIRKILKRNFFILYVSILIIHLTSWLTYLNVHGSPSVIFFGLPFNN